MSTDKKIIVQSVKVDVKDPINLSEAFKPNSIRLYVVVIQYRVRL